MRMTIKSRSFNREFEFWMPDDGGYVRLEREGRTGTLGEQICYGGGFRGNTISSSPDGFEHACRSWYRAHMRDAKKFGFYEQYPSFNVFPGLNAGDFLSRRATFRPGK